MMKENFRLGKVKIDKKAVTVNYTENGNDEEVQVIKKITPHPDLMASMSLLKGVMSEFMDLDEDSNVKFNIRGVTLSERKGTDLIIVTAVFTNENGEKTCINTANITINSTAYEVYELPDIISTIIDEVYAFLFENKHAQLDIVTESQKVETGMENDELEEEKEDDV